MFKKKKIHLNKYYKNFYNIKKLKWTKILGIFILKNSSITFSNRLYIKFIKQKFFLNKISKVCLISGKYSGILNELSLNRKRMYTYVNNNMSSCLWKKTW